MNTQLQQRAGQVARRLSAVARSASTRISAMQQAILKEKARREEKERRFISGRVSRALRGLGRLLLFAKRRSIQQLVKANEHLNGKGQHLPFHGFKWNVIGSDLTSWVSFSIGSQGITITMTNTCWRRKDVSATFPFKGSEVLVHTEFAGRDEPVWKSSIKDVLNRMATALMEVSEESEIALRVLGSWSCPAPFEKVVITFFENLEMEVASRI